MAYYLDNSSQYQDLKLTFLLFRCVCCHKCGGVDGAHGWVGETDIIGSIDLDKEQLKAMNLCLVVEDEHNKT